MEWLFRFISSSSQAEDELSKCQSLNSTLRTECNQLKVLVSHYKDAADKIEADLIQKFAAVLNEKKKKIRTLTKNAKDLELGGNLKSNEMDTSR